MQVLLQPGSSKCRGEGFVNYIDPNVANGVADPAKLLFAGPNLLKIKIQNPELQWDLGQYPSQGLGPGLAHMLGYPPPSDPTRRTISIEGLPPDANELTLYEIFAKYGAITSCKVGTGVFRAFERIFIIVLFLAWPAPKDVKM